MGVESGADERNEVRRKIRECFTGYNVIGLPYVTLEDGQKFDYSTINERFKDELKKMANTISRNLKDPR